MSWSVSASGHVEDVRELIKGQFLAPLADEPNGLADDGERETVKRAADMIDQCLATFTKDKNVDVSASGHAVFDDTLEHDKNKGFTQTVNIAISPRP